MNSGEDEAYELIGGLIAAIDLRSADADLVQNVVVAVNKSDWDEAIKLLTPQSVSPAVADKQCKEAEDVATL